MPQGSCTARKAFYLSIRVSLQLCLAWLMLQYSFLYTRSSRRSLRALGKGKKRPTRIGATTSMVWLWPSFWVKFVQARPLILTRLFELVCRHNKDQVVRLHPREHIWERAQRSQVIMDGPLGLFHPLQMKCDIEAPCRLAKLFSSKKDGAASMLALVPTWYELYHRRWRQSLRLNTSRRPCSNSSAMSSQTRVRLVRLCHKLYTFCNAFLKYLPWPGSFHISIW